MGREEALSKSVRHTEDTDTHTHARKVKGEKKEPKKKTTVKKSAVLSLRDQPNQWSADQLWRVVQLFECVCVYVCVWRPLSFWYPPPPPSILLTPLLLRQACLANKPTRCLGLLGIDKHRPLSPHFPSRGRCPIRWLALVMLRLYLLGRDRRDGTIATDHG